VHLNLMNCLGIQCFPKQFAGLKELIHLDLSHHSPFKFRPRRNSV
jgi:hypothetical protein